MTFAPLCRWDSVAGAAALLAGVWSAQPATAATAAGHGHARVRWESGQPLPDRQATPGRWTHDGPSKFCHSSYIEQVRDVSETTKRRVFAEYGISYAKHSHYEVDHLVPLELGGSNSIKNLWPEKGKIPNAKDGVENELHDLVCQPRLGVGKTRRAIARDWVKAMRRYGSTGYVYERSGSPSEGGSSGESGSNHSCTTTSSGHCIKGGEFCPQADYGQTGYDASGDKLAYTGDRTHPHWEH